LIEPHHPQLSIIRQCELLGLARSSYYYEPAPESEEDLLLMRLLDEQYTRTPFYGKRKMVIFLQEQGYAVDRKRVRRLMQLMGLETIYPKPRLSLPGEHSLRYPYLLRGMSINRIDQVWSCDITYIRLARGFVYLMAIIDWFSRFVLAWELSNTLDTSFCLDALDRALTSAHPEIFNTDQGVQFTSKDAHQSPAPVTDSHQLGWTWTSIGQCLRRALVAQCEIRGGLHQRLSNGFRCKKRSYRLLSILQL
jgi:putative transposase